MLRLPRLARALTPPGAAIVRVERMSPAFSKFHLDDGRALHRFMRPEPHADPHDHPWGFETEILAGGYVEEVFRATEDGGWRAELVHRHPFTTHHIPAAHIHRKCWTLGRAGPWEREVHFWRFGDEVRRRHWRSRRWTRATPV